MPQFSVLRHSVFLSLALALPLTVAEAATREGDPLQPACDLIAKIHGIEKLSKFERAKGSYRFDSSKIKLRDLSKDGWPHVVIPSYEFGPSTAVESPYKGLKFSDESRDVTLSVTARPSDLKQYLQRVTSAAVFEKNKRRSAYTFLEEALGVYVEGFSCYAVGGRSVAIDNDKSVAMFMSVNVLPFGGRPTEVYRLNEPRALLLVAKAIDERQRLEMIFPHEKDLDSVYWVLVFAPQTEIESILRALKPE